MSAFERVLTALRTIGMSCACGARWVNCTARRRPDTRCPFCGGTDTKGTDA